MKTILVSLSALTLNFLVASAAQAGELILGSADVVPGTTLTVPLTYQATGRDAVAVASDIRFNAAIFQNPRCSDGSDLGAGKSVRCASPKRGILRVAVFGLNSDALSGGELAKVSFDIPATAKQGRYKLRNKPSAADKDGNDFRLKHTHSSVRVGAR